MTTTTASLRAATGLSCAPRYATLRDPSRRTLGHEVAQIARALGTPLMPWQRYVADVVTEIEPIQDAHMKRRAALGFGLVYREVDLLVPRQSGKTTLILALAVHRALRFGGGRRQLIAYTAQTRNDARKKWEDEHVATLLPSLDSGKPAPFRSSLLKTRMTNGQEAIRWRNGSLHGITAVTEKSGHGPTLDLGFMDEAFAQTDDRLEQAMKPSMVTRPDAQFWVVSTAGTPASTYLRGKVDAGRERTLAGERGGTAYFEWSAPDDADPADVQVWRDTMPALGYTTTVEIIASERSSMTDDAFRRAYLNQWRDGVVIEHLYPPEDWAFCGKAEHEARVDPKLPMALALDAAPMGAAGAFGLAGSYDDRAGVRRPSVEVVDDRPGIDWMVERAAELKRRYPGAKFGMDARSPATSLLPDLQRAGVEVELLNAQDAVQACGGFFDKVVTRRLRHRSQPTLDAAVEGAKKRQLGDGWALNRRSSSVNIAPLVAVNNAQHVLATAAKPVDVLSTVW